MQTSIFKLLIFSFFIFLCPLFGDAQVKFSPEIAKKIDLVFSDWDQVNHPGGAIAVVQDEKVVYTQGYGQANLSFPSPINSNTQFHAADLSKQFVALSILLLIDDGKIALEDDIRRFLPEITKFEQTVTVQHLLAHTSGLYDHWTIKALIGWGDDDIFTRAQTLALSKVQQQLNQTPGEKFNYCNTDYILLTEIVERVTKMSFSDYVQKNIFTPLNMSNSNFFTQAGEVRTNVAYPYAPMGKNGYRRNISLSHYGLGTIGLYTTVEDLGKWLTNFSTYQVGNKAILNYFNTANKLNNGEDSEATFAQFIEPYNGLKKVHQSGLAYGNMTHMVRFPEQNLAIAVLGNCSAWNANAKAIAVADLFLEKLYINEEIPLHTTASNTAEKKYKNLTTNQLEAFTGNYWESKSLYARNIYLKKDTLRYSRGKGDERVLLALSDNTFKMQGVSSDIILSFKQKNGKREMKIVVNGLYDYHYEAYEAISYNSQELTAYTGDFYCENLGTTYHFSIKDGQLVASNLRVYTINLFPKTADSFYSSTWFFNLITYKRNAAGKIEGFTLNTSDVGALWFEKL